MKSVSLIENVDNLKSLNDFIMEDISIINQKV